MAPQYDIYATVTDLSPLGLTSFHYKTSMHNNYTQTDSPNFWYHLAQLKIIQYDERQHNAKIICFTYFEFDYQRFIEYYKEATAQTGFTVPSIKLELRIYNGNIRMYNADTFNMQEFERKCNGPISVILAQPSAFTLCKSMIMNVPTSSLLITINSFWSMKARK